MKKSDFYYDLPENLIAQTPVEPRNSSRMMAVNRENGKIEDKNFYNLSEYLRE
ncbi:MAG: S-adenosylmethionine:tRNA ribosyltransferase-isomerase, partial [Clostridia bacterium]|nr:S-adenosylmethionine:tRNA ribosyltransferase-isomerase [Clostridia bacterium]